MKLIYNIILFMDYTGDPEAEKTPDGGILALLIFILLFLCLIIFLVYKFKNKK